MYRCVAMYWVCQERQNQGAQGAGAPPPFFALKIKVPPSILFSVNEPFKKEYLVQWAEAPQWGSLQRSLIRSYPLAGEGGASPTLSSTSGAPLLYI